MTIKSPIFYGGEITCILGEISIDALDKILDLIDEYIELREVIEMGSLKVKIDYYPNGFGLMQQSEWQEKTFKDEMSCIEWCRRNHSKIGAINDYRTFGEFVSHFDIMDAINGKSR